MTPGSAALALGFSSIGHFFAHLLMLLYPTVVLVLEGRWGMSYGDLLSLSLGGFVLFGLGALPAGWLGDRWSAEGMMVVFFVGTGGAAIATGLTDGPVALAFGLASIGLFGSIYHPVGTAWLVRDAKNRGRALGVNGISGSIGLGGVRCWCTGAEDQLAGSLHHPGGAMRRDRSGAPLLHSRRQRSCSPGRPPARAGGVPR